MWPFAYRPVERCPSPRHEMINAPFLAAVFEKVVVFFMIESDEYERSAKPRLTEFLTNVQKETARYG